MKNSRTKLKAQGGFTLVEVIVVAVIVAAMAAVAVPMYLGYVDSSRQNAAANTAGSVASFCGACRNSGGTVDAAGLNEAGGGRLECEVNEAVTSSIEVPADIIVVHTAPEAAEGTTPATPGEVTGRHIHSGEDVAAASFNY